MAPRATPRLDGLRHLNAPRPIEVRTTTERAGERDARKRSSTGPIPIAIREPGKQGEWLAIASIADHWRVDDEWWREQPIARRYYEVALENGRHLTLFLDELSGAGNEAWYAVRT